MVPPTTEADEDALAADVSEDADEPTATSTGAAAFVAAAAVAAVFAFLAIVMSVVAVHFKAEADSANNDERTVVATTAARFTEAFTQIDADGDNKAEADVVHQLGTAAFIEQWDATIPSTRQLMAAVKVTSEHGEITPNGVFVGDIDGDQAQVVVVIDLVIVGEVTKRVPSQYLRMHLVKLGGEWKVDNVSDVNTALGAPAGGTTPSTQSSSG